LGADGKPTNAPIALTSTAKLNDQYVSEDATPKFFGGLGNTFTYKSISLTVFLQGAKQKGTNYLYSAYNPLPPGFFGVNLPVQLLNVWHQPGQVATLQKYVTGAGDAATIQAAYDFANSNAAWSDASYIRVKTVALSYNFSPAFVKRLAMQSANIFLNAQNLLTITSYKPGDPEMQTLYAFPIQRTIVAGINITF
jgi:hypothetical protein